MGWRQRLFVTITKHRQFANSAPKGQQALDKSASAPLKRGLTSGVTHPSDSHWYEGVRLAAS